MYEAVYTLEEDKTVITGDFWNISSVSFLGHVFNEAKPAVQLVGGNSLDMSFPFRVHHAPLRPFHDALADECGTAEPGTHCRLTRGDTYGVGAVTQMRRNRLIYLHVSIFMDRIYLIEVTKRLTPRRNRCELRAKHYNEIQEPS